MGKEMNLSQPSDEDQPGLRQGYLQEKNLLDSAIQ